MARVLATPPMSDLPRMTYEEFLEWAEDGMHAEWVDGEVIVLMTSSWTHQGIALLLANLLGPYVRLFQLGALRFAPFQMRLRRVRSGREPDLLFIATEHLDRVRTNYLDEPADLVIEIVSEDSVTRDRREKLAEYESAGVREYGWFDSRPRHRDARFFRLTNVGTYVEVGSDNQGHYHSQVLPGFWIDPTWLWQDPLPLPEQLLAEIAPHAWRDPVIRPAAQSDAE